MHLQACPQNLCSYLSLGQSQKVKNDLISESDVDTSRRSFTQMNVITPSSK